MVFVQRVRNAEKANAFKFLRTNVKKTLSVQLTHRIVAMANVYRPTIDAVKTRSTELAQRAPNVKTDNA